VLANAVLGFAPLARLLLQAGGIDPRRSAPRFAPETFHRWWRRHAKDTVQTSQSNQTSQSSQSSQSSQTSPDTRNPVVLWADTFSDGMTPDVPKAAAKVLIDAGFRVIVPEQQACCGLTWITTGQLDGARKRLLRLLDILGPYAEQGIPIVGLEPSCTAVLRSDLLDLLPDDLRSSSVAGAVRTLAELLTSQASAPDGWAPPDLTGTEIIVQPHCHHHAVMGFSPDQKLLAESGATLKVLAGCCGLAGNFGMEQGHYDVSVAVAENALLPALRARSSTAIVLADGFSCRTQAEHLAGARSLRLAELLAQELKS
jgi:Fe-S oxidoreductase